MAALDYTRTRGLRLTYSIVANRQGTYVISLRGKVLKVGMDRGISNGEDYRGPDVEAKAVEAAKAAIENLAGMREE